MWLYFLEIILNVNFVSLQCVKTASPDFAVLHKWWLVMYLLKKESELAVIWFNMASKTPTKYLLGYGISMLIEQVYNNSE